jgi:hypothetical protein
VNRIHSIGGDEFTPIGEKSTTGISDRLPGSFPGTIGIIDAHIRCDLFIVPAVVACVA